MAHHSGGLSLRDGGTGSSRHSVFGDLMRINRSTLSRAVPAALLLVLLALLMAGWETDTPQNTFAADGEVARDQRDLFYMAMWPAIGVMLLVELGLVVILLRFRRRRADEVPAPVHCNTRLELALTIGPAP